MAKTTASNKGKTAGLNKGERIKVFVEKVGPNYQECLKLAEKEGFSFSQPTWAKIKKELGLTRSRSSNGTTTKASQSSWEARYNALIAVGGVAAVQKSLKALEKVEDDLAVIEKLGGREQAVELMERVKAMLGT